MPQTHFSETNHPIAWVVGGVNGLAPRLADALIASGLKVERISGFSAPPPPAPRPSYIFCFVPDHKVSLRDLERMPDDLRRLLDQAARAGAKFLLLGYAGVSLNISRKIVDRVGIDKRTVILEETPEGKVEEVVRAILLSMFGAATNGKVFVLKTPKIPKQKATAQRKKLKSYWLSLAFGGLIISIPFLILALAGGLLALSLGKAKSGDFKMSQNFASVSGVLFDSSHRIFREIASVPVFGNVYALPTEISYLGVLASSVLAQASRFGEDGYGVMSGVLGNGPVSSSDITRLSKGLNELAVSVGFLRAHASGKKIPGFDQDAFAVPSLFELSRLAKVVPDLLGFEGKRKYLVLFQNNMELRPTGGFIGSFGLLTFEKGRLTDIKVQDVYGADGQLKGHVEPPEKLREHLGEANWYLRDSNWSPDFPTTARRAQWFLDKELGPEIGRVDGVLAVDLEFAKRLLGIVGEIEVQDFGEKVSERNFYETTQRRAEVGFFPGSNQKADFLTALNNALILNIREISSRSPSGGMALAQVMLRSLEERHALVYLENPEAQSAAKALGWDGGVKSSKCKVQSSKCVEDYLMTVDANVGVNKANYFMSKSSVLDVVIGRDSVSHKLLLSYSNRARQDRDKYKNYLRVYVPEGATNVTADIINSYTGAKSTLPLDSSKELSKDAYGALIEVSPNSSSQIVFSWKIPIKDENTNGLSFVWQKQSGTLADSVVLRFKDSRDKKFELSPAPSLTGKSGLGYTTVLDKDLEVNLKWILQ